ncbi:MAG TPA: histone deacetylase [Candidatus Binataceae bacterium]|nr:histone deacetylase [Candidatus Binataceae bacterium]
MLRTVAVADPRYLDHFAGRGHPESPRRVAVLSEMAAQMRRPALTIVAPRAATEAEIRLCHSAEYLRTVRASAAYSRYDFDPDTHSCPATYATALLAAGGTLTALDAVLRGDADNAFALIRPPGHHALPQRAMGFCFFNNVAIAAAYLTTLGGLERVLILDWDVHHGNGTQEIFYSSKRVLYVSLHQYPFYPGTGALDDIGVDEGLGYTINLPFPAGCGDGDYLAAFDRIVMPIARHFAPQAVLISAGFDAHARDPLAQMQLTEASFGAMTRRVKRLAAECCQGRLVLALEGGYDLQALAACGKTVLEELGREADEPLAEAAPDRAAPMLERARAMHRALWPLP